MSSFNRVLIIAGSFLSLVLWVIVALSALAAPQVLTNLFNGFVDLVEGPLLARLLLALIGAVLILISLLLLIVELMPEAGGDGVPIAQVSGAAATITLGAIRQRLQHQVEQIAHIVRASPRIQPRGSVMDVLLTIRTSADAPLVETATQASSTARRVVEQMGLTLRRLEIRVEPQPQRGRPAASLSIATANTASAEAASSPLSSPQVPEPPEPPSAPRP